MAKQATNEKLVIGQESDDMEIEGIPLVDTSHRQYEEK